MKPFSSLGIVLVFATFAVVPQVKAAAVTWDGNGDPNAGGSWTDAANWDSGVPTSSDGAFLLNVTSGTREVSVSSAQTINKLTVTQTTSGAVNQLDLTDDLTVDGNANPFAITASAGAASVVFNVGSGATLFASHAGSMALAFDGTLNLAAGATFGLHASGASSDLTSTTISGPINATGAGALISLQVDRIAYAGTINGAVTTTGVGSTLTIQRLDSGGAVSIMNLTFNGDDGSGNALVGGVGTTTNLSNKNATYTFTKRVSLAAASGGDPGAILNFGGTNGNGTLTANFQGGLVLGAGAKAVGSYNGLAVTVAGVSTLASGSEVVLQYLGNSGQATFANSGTLTMTDADLTFDYAATSDNNGTRAFNNSGTWVLEDGSNIAFISTTGRSTSAYMVGQNNNNSGTMTIKNGSTVGFRSLYNTGTLTLGSSTSGVSDTQVEVGSPSNTFTSVTLKNGATSDDVDDAGTINVFGNTFLGRTTYVAHQTTTLDNGDATSTGSALNVGDGSTSITLTMANTHAILNNAAGNTVTVQANGTLLMKSIATSASVTGNTAINNSGTFNHIGTLVVQGNFNGTRNITVASGGVYRVQGAAARLEAEAGVGSGINIAATQMLLSGQLTGASASDRLTFDNNSGNSSRNYLVLTGTGAEITPGAGSDGSGTSSIGTLELVDTNATFSGGTEMVFDIGGTQSSGLYDQFNLTLATAGSGAVIDLGSDSVLDIRLVNGYAPATAQTYQIIGAESRTGTFSTLLFNGAAASGEYTVNYLSNGVEIVLSAVPEPSTAALLACGGLATFLFARRKRRTA